MIKFISRLNLSGTKVDRESGIIKGVSLISLGEALGHGKNVDQKTLESVRDCAQQYEGGLRVKFNPNTFTHGAGMLAGRIPVDTIKVEGGKTIGDLHLYKSMPVEAKEYLFEIAEETPGNIGLSIEFTGEDEEVEGNKFARCDEIFSAVIVDLPAANPTGLFSVPEFQNLTTNRDNLNPNNESDTPMKPEELKQLVESNEFKSAIKQLFAEIVKPAEKTQEQKDKEKEDADKKESAAAGVTDTDDDKTKQQKLSAFRVGSKRVSDMSASELAGVINQGNMQFFRQTGGKPAKPSEGDGAGNESTVTKFSARVDKYTADCGGRKSVAINRARQDDPAGYNEWMAAQHPNPNGKKSQQMVRK